MKATRDNETACAPRWAGGRPTRSRRNRISVASSTRAQARWYTLVQEAEDRGGDLIDVRRARDGAVGLTIADVTGHGRAAAPYARRVRGVLGTLDETGRNSPAWLATLNDRLCARLDEYHLCCAISVKLRRSARAGRLAMSLAIAGMPAPLVYRAATRRVERIGTHALPLGVGSIPGMLPAPAACRLERGDLLVLFSDGVTEARGARGGMLGTEGVEHVVRSLAPAGGYAVVDGLAAAVRRRQCLCRTPDDFTIAVIAAADRACRTRAA